MTRPTRTVQFVLAAALLSAGVSAFATDVLQDTGGACIPDSERAGREFGCFILAAQPIGKLDRATFWHVETFPTRAAAEQARAPRSAVVEAFDKVWLLTIADAGWRSKGATHVAEIGPIATTAGVDYMAKFMEATFRPGMKSRIHRHSGAEAWYTLSGETCLETPAGTMVGRAGGPPVIVPQGPPMELTATGTETRRALVLILHDSTQPHTIVASDWKPKGLCTKAR
jgi:quercetin dioxygenase-like cupin family protein